MNQLFLFWRNDDFGTGEAIGRCDDNVCEAGLALGMVSDVFPAVIV